MFNAERNQSNIYCINTRVFTKNDEIEKPTGLKKFPMLTYGILFF